MTAPITTTIIALTALWVGFSAYGVFAHKPWVVDNLSDYGVPRAWWPWLGTAKALGAAGLVAGIWLPGIGLAAAAGLALYFVGALTTVLRARAFGHVAFPVLYLAPVVVAGTAVATQV